MTGLKSSVHGRTVFNYYCRMYLVTTLVASLSKNVLSIYIGPGSIARGLGYSRKIPSLPF